MGDQSDPACAAELKVIIIMESSGHFPNDQRLVKTTCGMCMGMCGINVHVENGKIIRVEGMSEHPYNRGMICVRARQIPKYVYSYDRLKYPMRKINRRWKRISWEEAIDTIAMKLTQGKERHGASSLGVLVGDAVYLLAMLGYGLIWRFCDIYGTPNRFDVDHLCGASDYKAFVATLGKRCLPDFENSKCIIVWGNNPHKTFPVWASRIVNATETGAKLIVIDPRRTAIAKRADVHIQPRPGTDGAIALAMLNVIISEGLYDREFVENWTVGFDRLAEHVQRYPTEWAELMTGVAGEDIRRVSRIYATTKPACIYGGMKLSQCQCGFQTFRSLAILEAITGNIDIEGGNLRASTGVHFRTHRLLDKMGDMKLVGADKYPLTHQVGRTFFNEGIMVNWTDLVLTGKPFPVTMMIISGANPVVSWPNSTKVRQALSELDFLVVMDVFMTPTAELADIVLPASTFLEKLSISPVLPERAMLRRPVIQPLWECWSDCRFWLELAKRMGYEKFFPWKDDEETLDYFLEPSGISVKYLRDEHPTGIISDAKHINEYKEKGFRTPSGKVELYSEELEKLGYDPLPTYEEPPKRTNEYPLVLTTGNRELEFWHSQHQHLPELRRRNPEPKAEIHPDTAKKYSICNGDIVIVETKTGRVKIKARVTEDILPDVVSFPHAWPGACENVLTDDAPVDQVTGYPAYTGLLCSIKKKTLV